MADGKADQRESTTLRRINPADGNDNDKEVADRLGISARTATQQFELGSHHKS